MTDTPGAVFIRGQNGKHSLVAPPKDEASAELPADFFKGCDAEGRPNDPAHPWHWSTAKKDA